MSDERIKVWPCPGRLVRHDFTREIIPAEGLDVELTRVMRRRIAAGDLLTADPRPAEESKTSTTRRRTATSDESEG